MYFIFLSDCRAPKRLGAKSNLPTSPLSTGLGPNSARVILGIGLVLVIALGLGNSYIYGFGRPWLWRLLALVDRNPTIFGLLLL